MIWRIVLVLSGSPALSQHRLAASGESERSHRFVFADGNGKPHGLALNVSRVSSGRRGVRFIAPHGAAMFWSERSSHVEVSILVQSQRLGDLSVGAVKLGLRA